MEVDPVAYRDRGYLPHLEVPDSTYFVTFRLAGTLPQEVLKQIKAERQARLELANKRAGNPSYQEKMRLKYLESARVQRYLDKGVGRVLVYILENPVKAGLCKTWWQSQWNVCSKVIRASTNREDRLIQGRARRRRALQTVNDAVLVSMEPDQQNAIECLLQGRIGMDPASVGWRGIENAVRNRMVELGLQDISRYRGLLQNSKEEWDAFVEDVIVPETWFFRDREPYHYLRRFAGDWPERRGPVRILSLPCASGEEPYSIAMTFLDAGFAPDRFRIDAIDISRRALQKAVAGVYGRNSFRGSDLLFRNRYFKTMADAYRLNPEVRNAVRFAYGNLLESRTSIKAYDIIFCRNLLIYFSRDARKKAICILDEFLKPDGLIFTGHAEAGVMLSSAFESIQPFRAFVHKKRVKS